jgi:hypothetical protein
MNFKDHVAQDNMSVFFNPDEFGKIHSIDGKDILVVIDADTFKERSVSGGGMYPTHSGIMMSEFTIYVKTVDIEKPCIGQYMNLDGDEYMVTDVVEAAGIYQITLGSNQA